MPLRLSVPASRNSALTRYTANCVIPVIAMGSSKAHVVTDDLANKRGRLCGNGGAGFLAGLRRGDRPRLERQFRHLMELLRRRPGSGLHANSIRNRHQETRERGGIGILRKRALLARGFEPDAQRLFFFRAVTREFIGNSLFPAGKAAL